MDTTRHELLTILGQAMAEAVDLHERQEAAGLDPLQRAGQILPLVERAADTIEAWARPPDATQSNT
jgi:hypothetical protein